MELATVTRLSIVFTLLLWRSATALVTSSPSRVTAAFDATQMLSTPPPTTTIFTLPPKPPPGKPCTMLVAAGGPLNLNDVCTWYDLRITRTALIDCEGCVLQTMFLGHGPQKTCAVTIKLPALTTTETACAPTPAQTATGA